MSETLSINTIRCLAADVVNGANSGHPGAPIGCAPIAYTLFHDIMTFDPTCPDWMNRDRFVLSNGHASALLYSMLHLSGYDVNMDDLRNFRQLHSRTPGHPEKGDTAGVEVTTGPLGQGISNAVGFAMAAKNLAAQYNRPGFDLFDCHIYTLLGDGCLQEGVASEACSLAGHLQLDNLIALWDDNRITIDGKTAVSFTEDVMARFRAYGWNILEVEDGNHDVAGIRECLERAKNPERRAPTLIRVHTTIGYGAPSQDTAKVHGSPLGSGVVELKRFFNMPEDKTYYVPTEVYESFKTAVAEKQARKQKWDALFANYAQQYAAEAEELTQRFAPNFNLEAVIAKLNELVPVPEKALATRQTSQIVLNALSKFIPGLIGGSADLKSSNLTGVDGWNAFSPKDYAGKYLHFGIREFGMCAISNGFAAFGGFLPFDATFLVFFNYCCGAIRVGALSGLHGLHVFTHDSIGVGQDGPTHQPIETLAWIRSMPKAYDWRPADVRETIGAYAAGVCKATQHVLALSRQGLPQLAGSDVFKTATYGAYVVYENKVSAENRAVILASGSEVKIAIEAAEAIKDAHITVVSVPSYSLFDEQPEEYKKQIIPALEMEGVPVVAIEPYCTFGWDKYAHRMVGINRYGLSAPDAQVYKELGITTENLVKNLEDMIELNKTKKAPVLGW